MPDLPEGGFPHFMLREIHEEPRAAGDLLRLYDSSPGVEDMVRRLGGARNLYFLGCGSSYHACVLGSIYFGRLTGKLAIPVPAPQFLEQYLPTISGGDVGLFVSQSGETGDLLDSLEESRRKGLGIMALANAAGSSLEGKSEVFLPLACGSEIGVPATKTFVNQALAFLSLALRLGGRDASFLRALPDLLGRTIERSDSAVESIVPQLRNRQEFYCLGYGLTYPIALEGALKIKETSYAHCEGMLSTEFMHGPQSCLCTGYPVLYVAGSGNAGPLADAMHEVAERGAHVVVVGPEEARLMACGGEFLVIPDSDPLLSPLLAAIPLQLLAYRLAVSRGLDPDFPRNLRKALRSG